MTERSCYGIDEWQPGEVFAFPDKASLNKWLWKQPQRHPKTVTQLRHEGYMLPYDAETVDPLERWIRRVCARKFISRALFDSLYQVRECNCRSMFCQGYELVKR